MSQAQNTLAVLCHVKIIAAGRVRRSSANFRGDEEFGTASGRPGVVRGMRILSVKSLIVFNIVVICSKSFQQFFEGEFLVKMTKRY
jgi:hypothetical protein